MAGIAMTMLFLGLFGGVVATVFHQKKRRGSEIPYQVQD